MNILAIDYGGKRVGLAIASFEARLPRPFKTLKNSSGLLQQLAELAKREDVSQIVVGLPRSLEGNETAQTTRCRKFAGSLSVLSLPVALQDEAGTSSQARLELEAKGKPYIKGAVDALAATYILEDYLSNLEQPA